MSQYHHLYNNTRWRTARAAYLAEHPTCAYCAQAGRVAAATVVDHAIPHRGDLELFWDSRNWVACCKPCHDGAKQSAEKSGKPIRGCDVNGNPLDPAHPWNDAGASKTFAGTAPRPTPPLSVATRTRR